MTHHQQATLALSDLRSGVDIGVDSRTRGRDEGIEELAADIRANGLLMPLGVWREPELRKGHYFVVFGNRRLAALQLNATAGDVDDHSVACVILECPRAELLALSAVENLSRLPLHPVDQYEAFAAMGVAGMSDSAIGARFGLTEREVRGRRRIGDLAEVIRTAWLADEIDGDAAMAFAVHPDKSEQARAWDSMQDWQRRNARNVRTTMTGGPDRAADLKFVGVEEYEWAGGKLEADLFGDPDDVVVLTPALLSSLVADKARKECEGLVKAGWKWAVFDRDLEKGVSQWSWSTLRAGEKEPDEDQARRLEEIEESLETGCDPTSGDELGDKALLALEAERDAIMATLEPDFTPEQRAVSGVVVSVGRAGAFAYRRAVQRPDDVADAQASSGTKPLKAKADRGAEPAAVLAQIREAQTAGLGEAFADDPTAAKQALAAVLGAFLNGHKGAPMRLTHAFSGVQRVQNESLAETVAEVRTLSPSALDRRLASLVGKLIDTTTPAREGWNSLQVTDETVAAVADLLDPEKATAAIRRHFDPVEYFAGAPKVASVGATVELLDKSWQDRAEKMKKGDAAEQATRLVDGLDWLPASIRPPRYVGPKRAQQADAREEAKTNVAEKRATRAKAPAKPQESPTDAVAPPAAGTATKRTRKRQAQPQQGAA